MSVMRSVVLGCGSYLPSRVVTNSDLSRMVDTTDEWITQRTGIRERRIAAEGETTSDMGIKAARAALAAAGVDAQSIDLVVLATSTPDNTFPASAVVSRPGSASPRAPLSTCRRSARASCSRSQPSTACCEPAPSGARW